MTGREGGREGMGVWEIDEEGGNDKKVEQGKRERGKGRRGKEGKKRIIRRRDGRLEKRER